MAKATIVEIKPVKPEEKVILELSVKEAAFLYALFGNIGARGNVGQMLTDLWNPLKDIDRVESYGVKISRSLFSCMDHLGIKKEVIPEED